jgi:hypothetical protein
MIVNVPPQRFGIEDDVKDVEKQVSKVIRKAKVRKTSRKFTSEKYKERQMKSHRLYKNLEATIKDGIKKLSEIKSKTERNKLYVDINKRKLIRNFLTKGLQFRSGIVSSIAKYKDEFLYHEEDFTNMLYKFVLGHADNYEQYLRPFYDKFRLISTGERVKDEYMGYLFIYLLNMIGLNSESAITQMIEEDKLQNIVNHIIGMYSTYTDEPLSEQVSKMSITVSTVENIMKKHKIAKSLKDILNKYDYFIFNTEYNFNKIDKIKNIKTLIDEVKDSIKNNNIDFMIGYGMYGHYLNGIKLKYNQQGEEIFVNLINVYINSFNIYIPYFIKYNILLHFINETLKPIKKKFKTRFEYDENYFKTNRNNIINEIENIKNKLK